MHLLKGLIDIRGIPEGYYHSYLLKLLIYIEFIGQYCFSLIMFLTSYNSYRHNHCVMHFENISQGYKPH